MISTSPDSNRWFVCPQMRPEAETRLFLFPYAGGGPTVFNQWVPELPDDVEPRIVHYPGRGSRHREASITQITALAENLSQAIPPLLDKPFVFFGHSLGALIAFELTRQLRQQNFPQPQILFISACGAPHLPDPHSPIHTLSDGDFLASLQELNGIPAALLHQSEVMQVLLPILRADFQAMETYTYVRAESPLPCPILAFGGLDDPRLSRERLEGWALHTSSGFKSQYFAGDHFFINTARTSVIASIAAELTSSYAKY
ncbi:MAG TPA: alpha/beta fold hydrolase [Anaerolineales bacterium]|nr:alpha/beta fold hydrolase [Anaerolineales bacterium]